MAGDDLDVEALDPHIRETVDWLRRAGFNTTDSGDGRSKPDVGKDGCSLAEPHVFMVLGDTDPIENTADQLLHMARSRWGDVPGMRVEASYSPIGRTTILMLFGVDDETPCIAQPARRRPWELLDCTEAEYLEFSEWRRGRQQQ